MPDQLSYISTDMPPGMTCDEFRRRRRKAIRDRRRRVATLLSVTDWID
jgi:hypothetical protein